MKNHTKSHTKKHRKNKRQTKHKFYNFGGAQNLPNGACSLQFNQTIIPCETCKQTIFLPIDSTMQRSKTADFFIGAFVTENSSLLGHPIKMYCCMNCLTCKIVYKANNINGYNQMIFEIAPSQPQTQLQPQPPVPTQT